MAGALRAAVRRVEKNAPIFGVAPLEQQLGTYLAQRRFQTSLLTGFSVVALLTFTTVAVLLTTVAIADCYFPARRAMRVDPIRALRVT